MDNVYQDMLQLIRTEGAHLNPNQLEVGRIISLSPLKVAYRDLVFEDFEIRISEHLTERIVEVQLLDENEKSIELRDAEDRVVSSLDVVKKIKIPSTLKSGDSVFVFLQEDVLWVIAKVV